MNFHDAVIFYSLFLKSLSVEETFLPTVASPTDGITVIMPV
jgi:hypothetical protein